MHVTFLCCGGPQVGYGDITPNTKYEMAACIVSMIIGGFIFGTIVGNLAELSKRANADELMRQKAVSRVQMVLSSGAVRGAVTPDLNRRIKSYYRHHLERNTPLDLKAYILDLPPELRDEMAEQIHWVDGASNGKETFGLLHKVPFFTDLSNTACISICASLKTHHVLVNPDQTEIIMEEGADCEEMYIVTEASRTVVLERGNVRLGTLSTGDFFGELGALLPPEMKQQRRRTRSAYATGDAHLGILSYDALLNLRREHYDVNTMVVDYTNQVLKHLIVDGAADSRPTSKVSLLDRAFVPSLQHYLPVHFACLYCGSPLWYGCAIVTTAHPELQLIAEKIDSLLDRKMQAEHVSQALPKERQEAILQKQLQTMSGAVR